MSAPTRSFSLIADAYRAHGPHVLRRAMRILGSDVDADEIVQEVFTSLIDDPSQFEGRSSLATWLYAATTNRCLNRIRDGQNRARIVAERGESLPSATSPGALEAATELRGVLTRLPAELAQVAVYYYGDEMTHEEIAAVLGCSRRHVGNLLSRLEEAVRTAEGTS